MTARKRSGGSPIPLRTGLLLVTVGLVSLLAWVAPATATETTAGAQSSPGEGVLDLPYKDLLIGWLLAAAIGAVGGVVYVGIVGPTHRDHRDDKREE